MWFPTCFSLWTGQFATVALPAYPLPARQERQRDRRVTGALIAIGFFLVLLVAGAADQVVETLTSADVPEAGNYAAAFYAIAAAPLALAALGLWHFFRKETIELTREQVWVTSRSLLGVRSWYEPLSDYLGIERRRVYRTRWATQNEFMRLVPIDLAVLVHPDEEKSIVLVATTDERELTTALIQFSGALGMELLN